MSWEKETRDGELDKYFLNKEDYKMTDKQTVKLKGKCEYANVLPGQERTPHPEAIKKGAASANDRHYQITVECSEQDFRAIKKAGLNGMHNLKYKDDDTTFITIKGTQYKEKGNMTFPAPSVTDEEGNAFTQNIGNGSVVIVEASLEKAGDTKALRLKGVQVLEHIPYEPKEEGETTTLLDNTGSKAVAAPAKDGTEEPCF